MAYTETVFTPSELVLLHGEQFSSPPKLLDKVRLIHNGQEVARTELVIKMLAAAVLAAEQSGALRLEIREKKGLLGLGKTRGLYMEPRGLAVNWPEGSVEERILPSAEQLKAKKGSNEVYNFVYGWIGRDYIDPWGEVITRIHEGLACRSLLDVEEKRTLKIFKSKQYVFPQRTAAALAGAPALPVKSLLENCERTRPDVWKMLTDQIRKAIKGRVEQTDNSID